MRGIGTLLAQHIVEVVGLKTYPANSPGGIVKGYVDDDIGAHGAPPV